MALGEIDILRLGRKLRFSYNTGGAIICISHTGYYSDLSLSLFCDDYFSCRQNRQRHKD